MKKFLRVLDHLFASLVMAGVILLFSLLLFGFKEAVLIKGIETADAAGWVQAFGGILAIFAALYVLERQIKSQKTTDAEKERRESDRREKIIYGVTSLVRSECLNMTSVIVEKYGDWSGSYSISTLRRLHTAIGNIEPLDLPSPEMIRTFIAIQACLDDLFQLLEACTPGEMLALQDWDRLNDKLGEIVSLANDIASYELA